MKEYQFHKIMGYNDNYYITDEGYVYSLKDGGFIPVFPLTDGRTAVNLEWNGRKFTYALDKLVVNSFFVFPIECLGKPIVEIVHKNGDITDNDVRNLKPILSMEELEEYSSNKRKVEDKPVDRRKQMNDLLERINKSAREKDAERKKEKTKKGR